MIERLNELISDYEEGRWRQYDAVLAVMEDSRDLIEALMDARHGMVEVGDGDWECSYCYQAVHESDCPVARVDQLILSSENR